VVQFPQGFPFLRLEFRDARRFLEDHPAILWFAGENLRDVPLSHDAVAAPPDPGAQEQFLDVLEAAWRAVDKVLAASVTENPPGECDLIVSQLDPGSLKVFCLHVADG